MAETIIIVDDDVDIVEFTASVLKKRGYTVLPFYQGDAALAALRRQKPALVITDVLMPGISGFDLYKTIKADEATRDIPVLIISGRGAMEDSFRGIGADDFIVKPFLPEDLLAKVGDILAKARNQPLPPINPDSSPPFYFN